MSSFIGGSIRLMHEKLIQQNRYMTAVRKMTQAFIFRIQSLISKHKMGPRTKTFGLVVPYVCLYFLYITYFQPASFPP